MQMNAIRLFAVLVILFISNDTISQEDVSTDCFQIISGTVKDKDTNKVLKNVTVKLYQGKILINTINSNNEGVFNIRVTCENSFLLVTDKSQYTEIKRDFVTSNISNIKVEFALYIKRKQTDNCTQIVNGKIIEDFTKSPIEKVTVQVFDKNNNLLFTDITNSNGNYHFNLPCRQQYTIIYSKKEYVTTTTEIETSKTDKKIQRRDLTLYAKTCNQSINGIIINSKTNEPVKNASVVIFKNDIEQIKFNNLSDGTFSYIVTCLSQYKVKVNAPNFGFVTKLFKTTDINKDPFDLIFNLNPVNNNLVVEEKEEIKETITNEVIDTLTISEKTNLELINVKFKLNMSKISRKIASELDKIIQLMNNNPKVTVQLNSHTDNRGPNQYNINLTKARTQAMISYVISNGIIATRVTGKGYGGTKPLNECTKEKRCTESEHQKNKRIEFIMNNE